MIKASVFVDQLVAQGTTCFTGVPCSYLTPLIDEVIGRDGIRYVPASSEGDAVSIAAGVWLAGGTAVVLCQNSGLGNMVNPITSLNDPFGIPVLLLVTWRGRPGVKDEPQHALMGRITPDLLTLLGLDWAVLPDDGDGAAAALRTACESIRRTQRPYALVVSGDTFGAGPRDASVPPTTGRPSREEVLAAFLAVVDEEAAVIATTGKTGRELFTLADRPGHLYCVGSMGYASSVAHGVALTSPRPVYVLDGDGAAIMHLGNFASIGAEGPRNLVHIVLDNGCYDSTGGQPTVSSTVDFVATARGLGYRDARSCGSCAEFAAALRDAMVPGPRLLHVPVSAGSMARLGRPTVSPHDAARRLRRFLTLP
ncbi:phosphonopyruvate decarboxylase [Azospirillum thermophilum]|uniref:Phosphonopyruvate decarboxylase n=1 Tax=Azospirillum thermophilum TaxID=2202148 RepID=A0A2S2CZN3_9PROT|nr:phosphonopyruvate decarboxylase [Azospirillum thermophilum]AWK89870.1 phosphonopyruvate decarboxylase [Azospirillum thermophilum]